MASNEGPQLKGSLRFGTGATGWSSCPSSSRVWWPEAKEDTRKPAGRARKPKRTSFACLECSRTFLTQQAMAGHCSAHTRSGARRAPARHTITSHLPVPAAPVALVAAPPNPLPPLPPQHQHHHSVNAVQYWYPPVQVTNPMPAMPPLAVRYVPYARPVSNQMMVRLPYVNLHGRRSSRRRLAATTHPTTNPAFRPVTGPMPSVPASGRLGWRAFLPIYSVPLPPCTVNGAPPGDAVSSTDRPAGHTRAADLKLRLGSGRDNAKKRPLPLLESLAASEGQQSANRKCKEMADGDDRGSKRGIDRMDGLDLELRLCIANCIRDGA